MFRALMMFHESICACSFTVVDRALHARFTSSAFAAQLVLIFTQASLMGSIVQMVLDDKVCLSLVKVFVPFTYGVQLPSTEV